MNVRLTFIRARLLCRPFEPGLNSDGSQLTGLLQQDSQQSFTTDATDNGVHLQTKHVACVVQPLLSHVSQLDVSPRCAA